MRRVKSLDRLYDFIATVVLYAPDRFPKRDYLKPEEQLNLERAFEELNSGMEYVREKIKDQGRLDELQQILDDSLAAYRVGDDVKGAHLLQDFEEIVFKGK